MKKYLFFLKYLKRGKKYFIIAFLSGLGFGAMSGLGIPLISQKVFKNIFESPDAHYSTIYIIMVGCLLPGIFAVRGVLSFLNGYFMSYTNMVIMRELRADIFKRIQFLPLSFFDKNSHGDLIARLANDPMMVQNATLQFASEIFKQPIQMFAAFCTLIYICVQHSSYMMIPLFFISVAAAAVPIRMVKKGMRSGSMQMQNLAGGIFQHISENLDAVAEIRSFNLQETQINKHDSYLEMMKKMCMKLVKYQRLQQPVVEFVSATIVSVVFVYGYFINMPFSAFMALGTALYFATDPMKRISNLIADLQFAEGAVERIRYVLDMPLHIEDPENPVDVDRLKGEIEFKNVNFAYDKTPTLAGVNVHIPAGTKVALVGHSGAGKSTFSKLVSRFYDVNEGEISIDNIGIKDMRIEDLRRNIAIVPQYPVLFNDSILSNIMLGRPDAKTEEAYEAAVNAFAHNFIEQFEEKYETKVGERGDLLSGGQKQRVALARAFLKNAPILVLDEATSSLDSESEYYIQEALKKLTKDKTVITIAHRLSTIKSADMIIVFDHGHIVGKGTHTELIKTNAIYRNFVEKQNLIPSSKDLEEELAAVS